MKQSAYDFCDYIVIVNSTTTWISCPLYMSSDNQLTICFIYLNCKFVVALYLLTSPIVLKVSEIKIKFIIPYYSADAQVQIWSGKVTTTTTENACCQLLYFWLHKSKERIWPNVLSNLWDSTTSIFNTTCAIHLAILNVLLNWPSLVVK